MNIYKDNYVNYETGIKISYVRILFLASLLFSSDQSLLGFSYSRVSSDEYMYFNSENSNKFRRVGRSKEK